MKFLLLMTVALATTGIAGQEVAIKNVFKDDFYIGAAISGGLLRKEPKTTLGLAARQFNSITPENSLKWKPFNPETDVYNQAVADAFVDFGVQNKMYVVGHVLFWHAQTPDWVFLDAEGKHVTREELLTRMRQRVRYLATRYKGKIDAWDVVNEAVIGDGSLRKSPWTEIIGKDFIEQAFRIADEELPSDVELIYNDYSMTGKNKRDAVVALVNDLKKKGVRIDGVGMQGHWSLSGPSIK